MVAAGGTVAERAGAAIGDGYASQAGQVPRSGPARYDQPTGAPLTSGARAGGGMTTTIFDRYGGFATMRKVVSAFYDRVLDSDLLAHHFADVDMRQLISHQTVFIAYLTGGPGAGYSDEVLRRVHAPLGITAEEFAEMLTLLTEALEDQGFNDEDVKAVTGEFAAREHLVVTG